MLYSLFAVVSKIRAEPSRVKSLASKIEKFKGILEVSRVINSTLEIQEVLSRALTIEQEVMEAEAGSLLLLDEQGEHLRFVTALGEVSDQLKAAQVKVGQGLAGWVAEHRQPLLIPEAAKDPRFDASFDRKTGFTTRSMLCIPLLNKDKLLGVAQVINRRDGAPFDEDDLELFEFFGGQVAVSIDNAFLHKSLLAQQRIEQELETARLIQRSFLPETFPQIPGLALHAANVPARYVSGDFYDCFQRGNELLLIIGDVSGKGVPAALYMANLINMLRYRLAHAGEVGAALQQVNAQLERQGQRGMFVTLAILVIEIPTREVTVWRAGHLPPLVLRSDGSYLALMDGGGPPLGILPVLPLTPTSYRLQENETLLLYTDGVTESKTIPGPDLGHQGLAALAGKQRLPLPLLCARLLAEVNALDPREVLHDDCTLIAVRCSPAAACGPELNLRTEFTSDPRYLRYLRQVIEYLAPSCGFDPELLNKLKLALDEAVTNIIRHSYGGRNDGVIEADFDRVPEGLRIRLRDYGKQVDVAAIKSRPLDQVRPGGLGVHFIRSVMETVDYDTNFASGTRLTMVRRLAAPEAGDGH